MNGVRTLGLGGVLLLAALASGCAASRGGTNADVALARAAASVEAAERSGARDRNGPELALARSKLAAARSTAAEGRSARAERLAVEAELDSSLATAKANNAEVQAEVAELRESIRTLQQELRRSEQQEIGRL